MNFMDIFKQKAPPPAVLEPQPENQSLDLFVHPFQKGNLDRVEMKIGRPMFGNKGDLEFAATCYFRGGASTGWHEIKGDNLQDLVNRVNAFLETL
jgi:hypothetical protein